MMDALKTHYFLLKALIMTQTHSLEDTGR